MFHPIVSENHTGFLKLLKDADAFLQENKDADNAASKRIKTTARGLRYVDSVLPVGGGLIVLHARAIEGFKDPSVTNLYLKLTGVADGKPMSTPVSKGAQMTLCASTRGGKRNYSFVENEKVLTPETERSQAGWNPANIFEGGMDKPLKKETNPWEGEQGVSGGHSVPEMFFPEDLVGWNPDEE